MKVFVSWSKARSHAIAMAIHEWLPTVVQECREIFVSSEQEKGVAWFSNIAEHIDEAAVGLVLITPENQHEAWLNFEGGALLGRFQEKRVCPVLIGMKPSEYSGPLTNLHMTVIDDKADVLKLLKKISSLSTSPIEHGVLEKSHERAWPDLESAIKAAEALQTPVTAKRSDSDKIDEMLSLLRSMNVRDSRSLATAASQRTTLQHLKNWQTKSSSKTTDPALLIAVWDYIVRAAEISNRSAADDDPSDASDEPGATDASGEDNDR
jgi:hypothetical protein